MFEIVYSLARPECVGNRKRMVIVHADNSAIAIERVKASDPEFDKVVSILRYGDKVVVFIKSI